MRSSEVSAPPRLIGREHEVEVFRSALRAVENGVSRIIHLRGEVGAGRTRLLESFASEAIESGANCVVTAPSRPIEAPFAALHRAPIPGALASLRSALETLTGHTDPFDRLIDALADDARRTPLWLLMDDVHAADEATRTFVGRLLIAIHHGRLRQSRVGVVLSLAPAGDRQRLAVQLDVQDRRGTAVRMTLAGFDVPAVQRWLEARLSAPAEPALARLLGEASGGNPLLLTELTGFLEGRGMMRPVDGLVRYVAGGATGIALPRDLNALLRGRMSAISSDCRRAMTFAAFLGDEFDAGSLAHVMKRDAAGLDALIDEAANASLVERQGGRVRFKHDSARELLYAARDRQSRQRTHLEVCRRLIDELGDGADEHCLTITHHLVRAGDLADPALLVRFASRAAELAFSNHSYYLAGRYYQAAAGAATDALSVRQRAELYWRAGEAFQRWSDDAPSTQCFEASAELYEQCDDLAGQARALQGVLRNRVAFGEARGAATVVADRLQGLLGTLPDDAAELKVRVYDTLAGYHHNAARYDAAESYARQAMTIARSSEDPGLRCIPVTSLALAQMEQLRLTDAKATWLEGLSYDRATGATRYEGLHLQRLPVTLFCMGEIQEAVHYNQASYHHNEKIGNTGELCLNLTVDVMIANLRGEFDVAAATGREALELMGTTRYLWSAPSLIGALVYALTMKGRFDDAASVIEHLSSNGLTFEDTSPFRSTALRLRQLLQAHRAIAAVEPAPFGARDPRDGPRGVRVGSVSRLCGEAELALFQSRPERLSGVHDALEFVHRRGLVLALGWCCSVPRALAVSTALRSGMNRARTCFDAASRLAERVGAPLEDGRVALCRGLAGMAAADGDAATSRHDLANALACFEHHDAPALVNLARAGLARPPERPVTH